MSSEPPKPGAVPGWGQPPDATPTEPVPAPAAPDAAPGWGQPAAPVTPEPAAPPPIAPAPAEPAPAAPGWGQPPAAAPVPAAAPAPPAPAPPAPQAPAPQGPPPSGAWGAPPPAGFAPGGAAPGGVPPTWVAEPAPPAKGNGCLKACLIVGVILVILFGIALAGLYFLGRSLVGGVVDENGNLKECPIVSNAKLSSVMGEDTQGLPASGIFGILGSVLDTRVLPDAESCIVETTGGSGIGRIARYQGNDAASVYQQEKQKAQPTSQDQGNGVTLESEGYFGGDVSGLGDEAFCTGVSTSITSGVLVRKGDTLVYVSLLGSTGGAPNLDATASGVITDPATCEQAQQVAKVIIGQ